MRLPVRVHGLELLPEGVRSQSEKRMGYLLPTRIYDQIGDLIPNRQEECYNCMCQNG